MKIDGVAQMMVVLTHKEMSCLVLRFGGPAFVLILLTLRFLSALFALIRP